MSTRSPDLRFAVFALRMKFLTRAQFLEAAGAWLNGLDVAALSGKPARTLAAVLEELRFIDATARETVEAVMESDPEDPGIDEAARAALLELRPPGDVRSWLLSLRGAEPESTFEPAGREKRYELGSEIGRGGLGRVMEARDRNLERDVAVKLVLDGLPGAARERFVREARITARLEHPNIVPVHDFDELPAPDGTPQLMLCMKRITGRDLGTLLREIGRDDELSKRWTQARLLRVFQDVCLGMAFAHDRGVLHRDLKPSNIMIGDYGETLIVDWGLAKVLGDGAPETSAAASPEPLHASPELTAEGDLIGTPLYMSPEQASGRISEMDARSDIYSLGAILYNLLTYRSPFAGTTRDDVIRSVLSGRIAAPSKVVEEARSERRAAKLAHPERAERVEGPESVPPDLDAICTKALALRKEDRFRSARDLHDEIQLFLEGVKERERAHRLAEEAFAKAQEAAARHRKLKAEASAAKAEARKLEGDAQPRPDRKTLWDAQDRARTLELGAVEAFAESGAALAAALGHERGHAAARRLNAELYWSRFLDAEALGDAAEMLLARRTVEQFNDGAFDALLKGDGALSVGTRAYPCRCLVDGRTVQPSELLDVGYHPYSGRPQESYPGAEGMTAFEPAGPVTLRVHAASCAPDALDGAHVWLWRYEEIGRLLIPVTPQGAEAPPAPAPIDALFAPDSPYRPHGPGLHLGRTPVPDRVLPMGSYLLVLARDGFAPVRCPVALARCGRRDSRVTLFRPGEIGAEFVPVPEGNFIVRGDPIDPFAIEPADAVADDFAIARQPVTCREYAQFLNALSPEEASLRVPRESQEGGHYWAGPPWGVPTAAWLASAPPALRTKARRLQNSPVDWHDDWPVMGISWEDAMAYAHWRRARDGALFRLPHDHEWEKTARGPDRRFYPSGNHGENEWFNWRHSHADGMRPVPVSAFPHDESPYGVRGLAGNSRDCCLNDPGPAFRQWRIFRGGNWTNAGITTRATFRTASATRHVNFYTGIRLTRTVRLGGRKPEEADRMSPR